MSLVCFWFTLSPLDKFQINTWCDRVHLHFTNHKLRLFTHPTAHRILLDHHRNFVNIGLKNGGRWPSRVIGLKYGHGNSSHQLAHLWQRSWRISVLKFQRQACLGRQLIYYWSFNISWICSQGKQEESKPDDFLLRFAFLGPMAVSTPGSHTRVQNHTIGAVHMACLRNAILFKNSKHFYEVDYSARTQTFEGIYIAQHEAWCVAVWLRGLLWETEVLEAVL